MSDAPPLALRGSAPLPRYWSAWSGAERDLWRQQQQAKQHATAAHKAVSAQLDRAHWQLLDELEEAELEARVLGLRLVAARLHRLQPHLHDLIEWALDVSQWTHEQIVMQVDEGVLRDPL